MVVTLFLVDLTTNSGTEENDRFKILLIVSRIIFKRVSRYECVVQLGDGNIAICKSEAASAEMICYLLYI